MNKFAILLVVLALCAACVDCAGRRTTRALASGNATQLVNDKPVNITTLCDETCPDSLFSVVLPKVTFRPNSRNVEFMMSLTSVSCVDDTGLPIVCPAFSKDTGMRLIMRDSDGKVFLNFTVFQLGKLSNQHTAKNVQVGQSYSITISAPITDSGVTLTAYTGVVETLYDTSVPIWVIIVLVAGGILALFLLIVIIYCLHKKCTHRKDGYESFD